MDSNVNYRPVFISTIPRSGTYLLWVYFATLRRALDGGPLFLDPRWLAINELRIQLLPSHFICPGFLETYRGALLSKWLALPHYSPDALIDQSAAARDARTYRWISPLHNLEARIIFVYREPLSQCASAFRKMKAIDRNREIFDRFGVHDERTFLYRLGATSYLKQFFTYVPMKPILSDRILMVPFEALVSDRRAQIDRILTFMGIDRRAIRHAEAAAFSWTSPERMREFEQNFYGGSLGGYQQSSPISHFRQKRDHTNAYGEKEAAFVRDLLAEFDIEMSVFG